MKKKVTVGLLTIAAALAMVVVKVKASQPESVTEPFAFQSCSGDVVTGTVTFSEQSSTMANGNVMHVNLHESIHGTGMGSPSGDNYIINGEYNSETNVDIDPTTSTGEETIVLNEDLISQGSAPNERIKMLEHITVNANGTVTVDNISMSDDCTP